MKEFRKNEQGLFICEECEKTFNIKHCLSAHIKKHHNGQKIYYDKWLKEKNEGKCKICKKETQFVSFKRGGYKTICKGNNCLSIRIKQSITPKVDIKRKQTSLKIYGNSNYNNMNKNKKTKKEKYGNENYRNDEKIKQTCLEKYGVENPAQNSQIFFKTQEKAFKVKKYKNTNIYYRASYELDFLENYYNKFLDLTNAPSIKYKFNNKDKIYFPDFYIQSLNLIIEIKNSYLYNRDKNILQEKEKATISNGYKYIMIIDKNYNEFNDSFTSL